MIRGRRPRARTPRVLALASSLCCSCAIFRYEIPPPVYAAVVTEEGLTLQDFLVAEAGPRVMPGAQVTLHYLAWLDDGTQIDSSYDRGRPIAIEVGAAQIAPVIERAMAGMRQGSRRCVVIPPELGSNSEAFQALVPSDTVLLFDIDVLLVVEPEAEEAEPQP